MIATEGWYLLIGIFLFVLFGLALGVYCHFCGEVESGGHYYGSNENINTIVFVAGVKKGGGGGGPVKNKSRCKCSNKFKGSCKACRGEDFVDDGSDGDHPDFSDFGGDKGLDPEWGNKPDPIRSVLGNNSNNISGNQSSGYSSGGGGGGQDDFSNRYGGGGDSSSRYGGGGDGGGGYGGDSSYGGMMSDG